MSNRNILRGPLSNESEVTNQLRPQSSDNTSPINKHLIDVMMHTTQEWRDREGYVPPEDSMVIYTDYRATSGGIDIPGIKIGDGATPIENLPFITDWEDEKIEELEDYVRSLFLGETTTALYDGYTSPSIVIDGEVVVAKNGNIAVYNSREFIWDEANGKWVELGVAVFVPGTGISSAQQAGTGAVASGISSVAEGSGTIATNEAEHAEGKYNVSISGVTLHTLGIGTAANARKNAHTITTDGKHYIPGIGTYTGTETTLPEGQDLTTIVNSKAPIASPAFTGTPTAPTAESGTNTTQIATTAFVKTAIDNMPEPMIFKGSLGTGGTITSLPAASASNEGYTYKVITAGTYASQAAKVGDTFISTGSEWVLIPSGDEPSGTVTSIAISATSPIAIDSSAAITTSGTRTISHANSGVTAGTYKSVTVNATGHVTAGTNPTTISGYGITDAKIASGTITLGSNTITPVAGPASSTANHIATFSDTTGKVIKDSGYTIATSVPSGAVFTDTTYESKVAASGGTDVSLCTTGEKYTWNNKSNLTIGTTATTAAAGNHTHATTLAADTGTSSITLSNGGKYKLTAGGNSVIFTMPAGTSSDIYWAQYPTSTYSAIKAAYDASKIVLLKEVASDNSKSTVLILTDYSDVSNILTFSSGILSDGYCLIVTVDSGDNWTSNWERVEFRNNKVTSITSSNISSNDYYPSNGAITSYVSALGPIAYPPGKYEVPRGGGSGVSTMHCANGNIIFTGSTGTFTTALFKFFPAFMKSIGAYNPTENLTADEKMDRLVHNMCTSCIIKRPTTSGTMTKYSNAYIYVNYASGKYSKFTLGASASGNRIEIESNGNVTLTITSD